MMWPLILFGLPMWAGKEFGVRVGSIDGRHLGQMVNPDQIQIYNALNKIEKGVAWLKTGVLAFG